MEAVGCGKKGWADCSDLNDCIVMAWLVGCAVWMQVHRQVGAGWQSWALVSVLKRNNESLLSYPQVLEALRKVQGILLVIDFLRHWLLPSSMLVWLFPLPRTDPCIREGGAWEIWMWQMALKKNWNEKMFQRGWGLTVHAGCVMVHRNGTRLSIRRFLEEGFGFRIRSRLFSQRQMFCSLSCLSGGFCFSGCFQFPPATWISQPNKCGKTWLF